MQDEMSVGRGGQLLAGAVGVVLLGGCSSLGLSGSDSSTGSSSSTTSVAGSTSTSSSSSASAKPTPSTSTATVTVSTTTVTASASPSSASTTASATPDPRPSLPTSPEAYADAFVRAWGIGDADAADPYTKGSAAAELFAGGQSGGSTWSRLDSVPQGGQTRVSYGNGHEAVLQVVVDTTTARRGAPEAIVSTAIVPIWEAYPDTAQPQMPETAAPEGAAVDENGMPRDPQLPTDPSAYADMFIQEWGAGRLDEAVYLAGTDVVLALDGTTSPRGSWRRVGSTGSTVTYESAQGERIVLTVDRSVIAAGDYNGVTSAQVIPAG